MADRVFHYRHGWIPLDHVAASDAKGIQTRSDVAKAISTLPSVPASDRLVPKHQIIAAAGKVGATDLLPSSWHHESSSHQAPALPIDTVMAMTGGSAEKHLESDGKGGKRFTAERTALHDKIIASILGDHRSQQNPEYNILGGGPASGKSTMIAHIHTSPDAAVVNADDIKAALPEYKDLTATGDDSAAAFTHEESSYVAKRLLDEAFAKKINVTLDGTGDSSYKSLLAKITKARDAGYKVNGYYVTVPTEVAVARAEKRAQRTGRHVPRSVIENTHKNVSLVFPHAMNDFDKVQLYDNEAELKLILSKDKAEGRSRAQILEDKAWLRFVEKGLRDAKG